MKKTSPILLILLFVVLGNYTYAQPQDSIKVQRPLTDFTALHIEGPFDVIIRQGAECSISYTVPAAVVDRLTAKVEGHTLRIRNKHDNWAEGEKSWWSSKSWWHTHPKIRLYVTVRNPESVKASGSCNLYFDGSLTASSLKLITRGSAKISAADINVKTIYVSISGSGLIKLSGQSETAKTHISGSGSYSAKNLVSNNSEVHISGSGHAEINANKRFDARLYGSARVAYSGDAIVQIKKSGSSQIMRF